jgi:CubicO group peptidase (beta-lactamase class C family)
VHGGGEVAPGSVFRRDDSPVFLNLLSELVTKTAGRPAAEYAKAALGDKIGAPNLFVPTEAMNDGDSDGFSLVVNRQLSASQPISGEGGFGVNTAGYYHATCRDMAKVAQLFLNQGEWPAEADTRDGKIGEDPDQPQSPSPFTFTSSSPQFQSQHLFSPEFARQALSAAFPELNQVPLDSLTPSHRP